MGLLLWATDVHLDHLRPPNAAFEFGRSLRAEEPSAEGLVLTGDNAEAPVLEPILKQLQSGFGGPVYFVLGNHDYYRGSFAGVDNATRKLHSPSVHWLQMDSVCLTPTIGLAGCDGWYDARYGDANTDLAMMDFVRIEDLFAAQDVSRAELLRVIRERADESAKTLHHKLSALENQGCLHIIVATHVPPFPGATWHEGKTSDSRWSPFFSSKATGDVLLQHAALHPKIRYTTLCGHTHSPGVYEAQPNLIVYTGRARYGAPDLAGHLRIGENGVTVEMAPGH